MGPTWRGGLGSQYLCSLVLAALTHHTPAINHSPLSHYSRDWLGINPHNSPIIYNWTQLSPLSANLNCKIVSLGLCLCLHFSKPHQKIKSEHERVICKEMVIKLQNWSYFPQAAGQLGPCRARDYLMNVPVVSPVSKAPGLGTIKIWHDSNFYEYCIHTDELLGWWTLN